MCEYCGCQDVAAIGELTREHDLVVDLIGEARSADRDGDLPGMAQAARRIAEILGPHTRVEEDALFPALADAFPDQIAALEAEHRFIETVLADTARAVPQDAGWPQRLMDMLDTLRAHILKEQDGVFPAALAELSTEAWENLDAVRDTVGGILRHPSRPTDRTTGAGRRAQREIPG